MEEVYAYEREPYRRQLPVEVVEVGSDGDRPFALLSDTIFFPQGGGQPGDRGRLGTVQVLDTQRVENRIRHYLAATVERGATVLHLDWERRFDHMQQHTAQHLLSAVAADRFAWPTTSFHLGSVRCDVELAVEAIDEPALVALEAAVAVEVRAARPVRWHRVEQGELRQLEVRSRGLPEGHRGSVRLVEIEGIDRNTCGGTHLRSTAEIEAVKLLGTESMRGGTRLYWVAGERVRRLLAAHEARNGALRMLLETGDDELAAVVSRKLEQLRRSQREIRHLQARLAAATAEALVARQSALVVEHFEGASAAFLQRLAREFAAAPRSGLALLSATEGERGCFVVAAGGASELDAQALGAEVAAVLGARGGGSGRIFQGRAADLSALDEAVATMRRRLGADAC